MLLFLSYLAGGVWSVRVFAKASCVMQRADLAQTNRRRTALLASRSHAGIH